MNQQSLHAEIDRQAAKMSAYHGAAFSNALRSWVAKNSQAGLSESDIKVYARNYAKGVADERARILAIDAVLATMPPGYEALAHAAQFENPQITADDFVKQALRAHGNATQALARMRQGSA